MNVSQKWFAIGLLAFTGWLIYLLSPILMPFAIGALLAYLGDPFADKLENLKLSRTLAVVIVFSVMLLALTLVLLLLVPMLENQIARLIGNLPAYASWIKTDILPWLKNRLGIEGQFIDIDQAIKILKSHWQQAGGMASTIIGSLSKSSMVVAAWFMNIVLIPVVTFYLLRDWDLLVAKIHDLLPNRMAPTIETLAKESDEVLSAFFRGQFTVMLALGAIYSIGLWIIGLDLSLLIGIVAGLVSFIPYLGSVVGIAAACIAAIVQFHDVWQLIPVAVVFGVGQLLEGMVLTPLLVGDKIGLHPVAVIFAILAGGQLFGFLGILIALPVASIMMVLIRHAHDLYKDSDFYAR
ncbi:MAG: AI-2E family transporter [Methylococcales bacterium]